MLSIPEIRPETVEHYTKLELLEIIQWLTQYCKDLESRVKELEDKIATLSKNSSTSSKRPSSDIVKPPRTKSNSGKPGGQKGHPGFWRRFFKLKKLMRLKNVI